MTSGVPISTAKEKCFVCGKKGHFRLAEGACLFREAQCEHCAAGKRNSDLAHMVLETCLGSSRGSLESNRRRLAKLHIYSTSTVGRVHETLASLPNYVASEYMDAVPPGEMRDGVRCEDLTELRLPADSFDLVVSEEVLEHVQDLEAAFLEVRRVLKPGGHFIFTVPVHEGHDTRTRATFDDTGAVQHLLPPVYHGDPVREAGSLVFTDFGRDLPHRLAALGMPTEDHLLGDWHAPDEVSWIDDGNYAEYRKHHKDGTLFSAFRYNSHVFVTRNDKLPFTGERFVPESVAPLLAEYEHVHRYAFALDFVQGKTVLDIACGEGFGSALLAARAERVIGVDNSDETIRHGRTRYGHLSNLEFKTGACEAIPCEDDSVDVVVSMETIEHIRDQQAFLAEVKRVLRPEGVLLVSTPNPENRRSPEDESNPYHVRELSLKAFRWMAERAFAHVTLFAQRAIPASFIRPFDTDEPPRCTWWVGDVHALTDKSAPDFMPKFFVAACSDVATNEHPVLSTLVSTRHQDVLDTYTSPVEAEKQFRQYEAVCEWAKELERDLRLLMGRGKRGTRKLLAQRRERLREIGRLKHLHEALAAELRRYRLGEEAPETSEYVSLLETECRELKDKLTEQSDRAATLDAELRRASREFGDIKALEAEREELREGYAEARSYARKLEEDREKQRKGYVEVEDYARRLEEERDELREGYAGAASYARQLEEERDKLRGAVDKVTAYAHELEDRVTPLPASVGPTIERKAVCTICSNNYLHFARTLMDSLRAAQPDWDPYVLICDEINGVFDPGDEPFNVVALAELAIPNPRAFCFRYTILELNTAVKPWLLEWLFEQKGYDQVVYLDPDIYVYEPLREVEERLNNDAFMVLTPHLTGRLDDDAKPSELEILRAGAYNLGFIALRTHDNLIPFLRWWQEKVEYDCVVDFEHGLFVDQKWVELVPGMFGDVALLRHEGYNVAYWNLKHRKVVKKGAKYLVNGQPLVFFHFSGLNPENPRPFSKHQDRYRMGNLGLVRKLVRTYIGVVKHNGLKICKQWPYAFGSFSDGTPIMEFMRYYYRQHLEPEGVVRGDPFELGHDYFHNSWGRAPADGPLVTLLMRAIWEYRKDLQEHYPDIEVASRWDYAYWFSEALAAEFGVPDCCVDLVRQSLAHARTGLEGEPPETVSAETVAASPQPPPHRGSKLRRFARWVLPRRVKRWIRQTVQPGPGSSTRGRRVARRLARIVPGPIRRRLRAAVAPEPLPVAPLPPRRRVEIPLRAPTGTYYIGFFDTQDGVSEDGLVWMGTSAGVRVLKPKAGKLHVTGQYIPEYFIHSGGSPETTVVVAMDGQRVGEFTLVDHGPFHAEVELPEVTSSRSTMLSLEPEQHFIPLNIGVGEDQRKLTLKIGCIELAGTVLLDFARSPDPFMPGIDLRHDAPGLNIIGYLQSELGVGESARLCTASADAAGVNYALVNFEVGCSSRTGDQRLAEHITNDNPHPVNLFHINADQMPLAYSCFGYDFFRDHYNIGFWHWELPEFPEEWTASFAYLQEIWVPSQFVMNAVSAKSPVPVVRMAHALGFSVPEGLTRKRMHLPDGKFLFLMMYDMHSFQSRKNPRAGLDAFRKTFPNPTDVAIVLKTMNTQTYPKEWAALEKELSDKPGIVIINKTLTRQEVYNLESLCDCFVSPHRSEGFGLGLAESMYLGKPVIGTNWSGNVDFMNEKNSCPADYELIEVDRDYGPYRKGQHWADVDIDHIAFYMKKLVDDSAYRKRIARAGQETMHTQFSPEAVGKLYRRRLEVIAKLL